MDGARRRNGDQKVAGFAHQPAQARVFVADNEGERHRAIELVVWLRLAGLHAGNPDPLIFHRLQGTDEIRDLRYSQMVERAGGRFGNGFGEASRVVLRQQDPFNAAGGACAQDGAKIAGIFDGIERNEQGCSTQCVEQVLQKQRRARCTNSQNSLVSSASRLAVQAGLGFEANGHTALPRQVDDLLKAAIGGALNDDKPFDNSRLSFQTFENGMDAEDDLHGQAWMNDALGRPDA